jgi:hypothetical protein
MHPEQRSTFTWKSDKDGGTATMISTSPTSSFIYWLLYISGHFFYIAHQCPVHNRSFLHSRCLNIWRKVSLKSKMLCQILNPVQDLEFKILNLESVLETFNLMSWYQFKHLGRKTYSRRCLASCWLSLLYMMFTAHKVLTVKPWKQPKCPALGWTVNQQSPSV